MLEPTAIALGFFDGVHIGHGELLRRTATRARAQGLRAAAFTFDRAPREFVTGERMSLLTDVAERSRLIRTLYPIDEVFIEPFDHAMMTMPWEDFIEKLLVGKYHAAHLICGHDFRFGHKNEGNAARLREKCAALGLGCDVVPKVTLDGVTVSSTHIRALVEDGAVESAGRFLGHPFALCGVVAHGFGVGAKSLFPTANLVPDEHAVLPRVGVYATRAVLADGKTHPAVTNIGVRPTVGNGENISIETFLLDFSGDLYGQALRVEFLAYLRPEQRFPTLDALKAQIARDAETARKLEKA